MARFSTYALGILLVSGLVLAVNSNLLFLAPSVAFAVFLIALFMIGPERTGNWMIVGALFTAPMMAVRPFGAAGGFVTLADLLTLGGAMLLLPRLLSRRVPLPAPFLAGWLIVGVSGVLSSLGSEDPALSVNLVIRFMIAGLMLPILFAYWGPTRRMINLAAGGYVLGQVISTLYALAVGPLENDRYAGLTFHPLFFGPCGTIAVGLLLYLIPMARARGRWIGYVALIVCISSVVMSGSRGCLGTTVVLILFFIVNERSALTAYWVGLGGVVIFVTSSQLVAASSDGSAIERLAGNGSTAYSDNARFGLLQDSLHMLADHPILGNGFLKVLHGHNIYLEVMYSAGLVGFLGFAMVLWVLVKPILQRTPYSRLGYATLAWLSNGMLIPGLWERDKWLAISLAFAATLGYRNNELEPERTDEEVAAKPLPPTELSRSPAHRDLADGAGGGRVRNPVVSA